MTVLEKIEIAREVLARCGGHPVLARTALDDVAALCGFLAESDDAARRAAEDARYAADAARDFAAMVRSRLADWAAAYDPTDEDLEPVVPVAADLCQAADRQIARLDR